MQNILPFIIPQTWGLGPDVPDGTGQQGVRDIYGMHNGEASSDPGLFSGILGGQQSQQQHTTDLATENTSRQEERVVDMEVEEILNFLRRFRENGLSY